MQQIQKSFPRGARVRALHALLALLLLPACRGGEEAVTIGVAGPVQKATGASMKRAVEMAMEEINATEEKLGNGRLLRLRIEDDNGDPNQAIRVATELRRDPAVVAVIGHVNSGATIEAAPVYNRTRGEVADDSVLSGTDPLVEISPASSSPDVTGQGEWTFRIAPTDLAHAPVLARHARQLLGRSRAALLYSNDDYGRGLMAGFADQFRRGGGTVVSADPYLPAAAEATDGLEPYLQRALRANPDVLVIAGPADGALGIIRTARRLGFDGPIMGGDGLTSLKDAGALTEGLFVSSAYLPDRADTASQSFVRRYRERYKELPDHRGAMAYDLVHLLARAIRERGADREAIREYLAGMRDQSRAYQGVSGTMWFDEHGDVQGKEVVVGVVRGKSLVTASR